MRAQAGKRSVVPVFSSDRCHQMIVHVVYAKIVEKIERAERNQEESEEPRA